MSKQLLIKVASVALAIFLSVTLLGFAFSGTFIAQTTNPQAEIYAKVKRLSKQYTENLLILVEKKPAVVQAEADNAKIGNEIKGLMDFQPNLE